ncbi:MAG: aminotransferase class I/II-fold pyridoxal phosphate-dependent enzyme [Methylocystaceae bacterium]
MRQVHDFLTPTVVQIPPSGIRKFFDLVMQTKGVISLGVGEPDFVTPRHVREACYQSLEKGFTNYTSNLGMLELRQEIANYMQQGFNLNYDPETEIVVTVGVSEAFDLAIRALVGPGDEVLVPDPSYVAYAPCATLAGGSPVFLATQAQHEFRLQPEELERKITKHSKVLILPYPNNPTGGIMGEADLQALVEVIVKHDLFVISDEIYGELTYGQKHISIATLPGMKERTLVLNGFSKAYAMTGWRVGYACGHHDLIYAMNKIHQYTMLCAPIMAQMAAIEALKNGEKPMREMIADYNQRRRIIVDGLAQIGMPCFEPRGAFYCFPSIEVTGMNSEDFCEQLLKEEKVAVVPGTAFGPSGEGYVRMCYAASLDNIATALERMGKFVTRHQK